MSRAHFQEKVAIKSGVADEPLFVVPAGCTVMITAVSIDVAYSSGTMDIVDGTASAAGTNILFPTSALAPTVVGVKRNVITLQAAGVTSSGWLFTTAGAVWTKGAALTGATGAIHVYGWVAKVLPGAGEP